MGECLSPARFRELVPARRIVGAIGSRRRAVAPVIGRRRRQSWRSGSRSTAGRVLDVVGRLVGRGQPDRHRRRHPGRSPAAPIRDTHRHRHAPTTERSTGVPCDDASRSGRHARVCRPCAVPLDHDDPDGATIDIALARVPATDPDHGSARSCSTRAVPEDPASTSSRRRPWPSRRRSPNVSTSSASTREASVRARPSTATSRSTTTSCCSKPGDDEGWNALLDEAKANADDCPQDTLDLAPYVGTNNAARDLDLIREALGDDQLSYVGFSYGTRLGATYAELFPENVRALVLDGGVKPTDDFAELDREQGAGFDLALENFAAGVRRRTRTASCGSSGRRSTSTRVSSPRSPRSGSFPTDDPDRVLTPGELQLGVAAALYSKDSWPYLAQALYLAETEQDGTLLQVLGDSLVGRQPDGTYNNEQEANLFINCADDPSRPDADAQRELADEAAAVRNGSTTSCAPAPAASARPIAIDPLVFGPAEGAAPILVIGNTGDPATPYDWSVALADSLVVRRPLHRRGRRAHGVPHASTASRPVVVVVPRGSRTARRGRDVLGQRHGRLLPARRARARST